MSTPKKTPVKILSTLDEDPRVNYFPWELEVRNSAASLCKNQHPRGLLSSLLTVAQWNDYAANSSVDAQGTIVIAPRYTPPAFIEINDTMTSAALYVAKASNDQLLDWITNEEALKTAIVKSLGIVVRQIIKHPETGFTEMTILDIMSKVRTRYGRMRKNTKASLEERMTTRLPSTDSFDTHVSNLRENFTISRIGGHTIPIDKQVDIFKASLSGHGLIDKALAQFDFEHPDESTHTFEQIVLYIEDHLPNLQNASKIATQATANIMASEAYVTLEAENKLLKAQQIKSSLQTNKKRKPGKGKGKGKKQKKGNRTNSESGSDRKPKYCWGHGTQHTHTSSECKLMSGDKTRFNAAMRNSTDSNHPPGGSTKVFGQEPK